MRVRVRVRSKVVRQVRRLRKNVSCETGTRARGVVQVLEPARRGGAADARGKKKTASAVALQRPRHPCPPPFLSRPRPPPRSIAQSIRPALTHQVLNAHLPVSRANHSRRAPTFCRTPPRRMARRVFFLKVAVAVLLAGGGECPGRRRPCCFDTSGTHQTVTAPGPGIGASRARARARSRGTQGRRRDLRRRARRRRRGAQAPADGPGA